MAVLALKDIHKAFGAETVIETVTLQLEAGDKAGLIGPNGSGKTTLLKIIAGEMEADGGDLVFSRDCRIGYLPQEPRQLIRGTLRKHLQHPLRHIYDLQAEIGLLEKEIAADAEAAGSAPAEKMDLYSQLTARFEALDGYSVESRLSGIARGLGFSDHDLERDLDSFSGGEKTRARLAGLLLQDLDLLLLDEPTNFLDIQALEWLEKYLRDLSCALLVVSHDRYFLDSVVERIFALNAGRVKTYRGNYSSYLEQSALEDLTIAREHRRLELLKEREERLVREAKADQRSKRQARSRQKRLDRLQTPEIINRRQSFSAGLNYSGRSSRQAVIFEAVSKYFDGKAIFTGLDFVIQSGDRIALVGPNGAGKSTLLKLISGALKADEGTIRLGPSVSITYFDQEQEKLEQHLNLLETISSASGLDLPEARNHLGRYLFRGDDVYKRVRDLSGGERSRLALACLALGKGNCLLMDEPTSHLDLPALDELEGALNSYPGTLIVVSHDRYFLRGLANRVFELKEGTLQIHDLTFEEYLERGEKPGLAPESATDRKAVEKIRRKQEHLSRQAEQKAHRRLLNEQARLEAEIAAAEAEISRIEESLSNPSAYGSREELAALAEALEETRQKLSALLEQWEAVANELEQ